MRIYVSSTIEDLKEYRASVLAAIRSLGHIAVAMEDYPAVGIRPVDKVLQDVSACDLYVGIFAWRYGFIPDGYDRSITELEYRQALARRIPTLIFLADERGARWLPAHMDVGDQRHRIDRLREELMLQHGVRMFDSPDKLALEAHRAISEAASVVTSAGGIGSGSTGSLIARPKVSLLRLPETGPARFGREREMKRLDEAWDLGRTNIVTLVAWGGVGKSALVNSWLATLAKEHFREAQSVFGWSFYNQESESQEASADVFAAEALSWFGDPHPNVGSAWEKGQRLAERVRTQRTLLIL